MRRFKFLTVISIILTQFSCKESKSYAATEQKFSDFFRVDLIVNIQDTTDLILYYKDGSNEWFVEEKAIWQTILGSKENQHVMFLFDDGTVPHDFRLDIGRNEYKNQNNFEIVSAILYYKKNKFEISQSDFEMYFSPNQYIKKNSESSDYILKPDEFMNYDPFFETTPAMYPKIAKLVLD